jgi:hypothetical protein
MTGINICGGGGEPIPTGAKLVSQVVLCHI